MHAKLTRRDAMQWAGVAAAFPAGQFLPSYSENGWMPFTPKFLDLVRNVATVSGSGPVTLGAPVSGFASLAGAVHTGEQFYYCIQGLDKPQEREVGRGTMQADGRVARQAIAGGLTNFTTGAKTIALVAPAEWFARIEQLGGEAMATAAARTDLAGRASGRAYLAEAGRAGSFVFDPSDLSDRVAADPAQGIHVPPASDLSGASGVWVRRFDGPVNVCWFGAKGDGTTDDGPAFAAAIAYLRATGINGDLYHRGSPRLLVPAGHYFLGTTTLDFNHTLIVEGEGSGLAGGRASKLRWAAGATGIRVQRHNTTGAEATIASGQNGGDGSIIRGLSLVGGHSGTEGEFHGIHLRARAVVEDCFITDFQGDGIHSNVATGGSPEGNANNSVINRVSTWRCRRGLFFDGADSNACLVSMLDASGNRTWGVDDSSFLGNTYIACHTAGNGWDAGLGSIPTACTHSGKRYYVKTGQAAWCSANAPTGTTADNQGWGYAGPGGAYNGVVAWASGTTFREGGAYKTDNSNARNVFIGCYSEGDQNPSQLTSPTIEVGGLHGAGLKGSGVYFGNSFGRLTATKIGSVDDATGNMTGIESGMLEFAHPANGQYSLEWMGNELAYTALRSAVPSNWAFRLTGETTALNVGKRRLDFPNGFGLNDKKVLSGSAAPTAGSFVQGDMMFNSAPTAGGPMGWMCVAAGTPGTWKAMGSLAA
jgi:hypothetical protein